MLRLKLILSICALMSLSVMAHGAAQQRIALVIGNGAYPYAPLKNPVNDAVDMAAALKQLKFSVTRVVDANQRTMEQAIRNFGKKLRKGGVGLFYFAGHGIQVKGRNYLIPIDAEIESEADVKYSAVDAGLVLGKMEDAGNELNLIILDACRNNPLTRNFRSADQGLAKMDAPTGSILAYSTAPGSIAADGSSRNGLYTEKLLKHMMQRGIDLPHLFMNVRREVVEATNRKQVPWESSSLIGNFYFVPDQTAENRAIEVKAKRTTEKLNADEEAWTIVKTSKVVEDYILFTGKFPQSRFTAAAELKIQQLKRKQNAQRMTAAVAPAKVDPTGPAIPEAQNGSYHLAIFPLNLYSMKWPNHFVPVRESRAINAIAAVASQEEMLSLKYCYKKIKNDQESVMSAVNGVKLEDIKAWKRDSLLSESKPAWEEVGKVALKIKADLVVMLSGEISKGKYDFYLYDSKNMKVYSQHTKIDWQAFEAGVQFAISGLVEDFLLNRKPLGNVNNF